MMLVSFRRGVVSALEPMPVGVVAMTSLVPVSLVAAVAARLGDERCRQELHAALRATGGLVAHDVWMHRADVLTGCRREQLHSALRAPTRVVADDVRMHRACIDDRPVRCVEVHFGNKGERLVR